MIEMLHLRNVVTQNLKGWMEMACVDEGKTTKDMLEFSEGDLMLEEFKSDPLD